MELKVSGLALCAVSPDRVWTCNGKVIGVAEGKQPRSRPTLLGLELVKQYKPKMPTDKSTTQLQQVCGQLHHNGLKYGLLYTDECFWFLRYESDSAQGILYVSEGIVVSQKQPTVFSMLLFVGRLAQQHAATSTPSFTCQHSLPLVLAFWGSFHRMIMNKSPPESLPHQLRMGALLGQGSTGSVRVGRIEDVDVAVKLLEEADDPDSACQRLQHELNLYQRLLHPLQGISVPKLMASGTIAGPTGDRQPFLALELLPVSLADEEAHLGASEFECVLEALNRIHQQGVLHGDIEPRHVVYSSLHTLAEPKWIDFSSARQAQSSKELADEFNQCHGMLQGLRRPHNRPNRLHRSAITQGFCPATLWLPCRSCVMTIF